MWAGRKAPMWPKPGNYDKERKKVGRNGLESIAEGHKKRKTKGVWMDEGNRNPQKLASSAWEP